DREIGGGGVYGLHYVGRTMGWRQSTAAATWVSRTSFGHAVHDNKLWLIGGYGNNYPTAPVAKNDVWYSADGFSWSQATAAAAWSARSGQRCVSFNGKLWLFTADGSNRDI